MEYVDGDPSKGAIVTIANDDRMVMPATVRVVERGGHADTCGQPLAGPPARLLIPLAGPVRGDISFGDGGGVEHTPPL